MSVVSAAQILRDIAASGIPDDSYHWVEPTPVEDPFPDLHDKALVTAKQIAVACKRSPHTVEDWRRDHRLVPAGRRGRSCLFRVGDVRRLVGFTTGTPLTVPTSGNEGSNA